ncbi:MAG TPA: uracil-DNA glycosylase [Synergistaceae bacterium]|nr:uracil-DNA glycosylase [Synergistaceae bacterium]HPJ25105.1 uracil-DNA glycosylase [Synergistaceae bacterium]HPQ36584.1 uracil-DNA glycosylase [Synergistaceae bacterium]
MPQQEDVKLRLWKALEREVADCTRCPLHAERKQTVFGAGDLRAKLVFVGEGPGAEEDAQGIPFVGRAGKLLTDVLSAVHISRDQVYITNIVKCRPPGNRNPQTEEMLACERYLYAQLALINPRIIVTLGNVPTQWLLKTNEGITRIRGKWFEWKGIEVMPMFHPSYLLRNQSNKKGSPKYLTWQDIQEIRRKWDSLES